jgi:hypothetical protein
VDFLWHRNTPSPNWAVIAPADRATSIGHPGWAVSSSTSCTSTSSSGVSKGGGDMTASYSIAAMSLSTSAEPVANDEDEL